MSLHSRIRRLVGWVALALYAATTSLCHLAHDPAAHGLACCDHAPRHAARHEHVAGLDHSACDHGHRRTCHEHRSAGNGSQPTRGKPGHNGRSCLVCQFLADPSLAATFAVELSPLGMVTPLPVADPLAAPQAIGSSYSSRAPPELPA